ncbi:MAG: C40 family peptidase [Candidatus Krumholzibacteriales bacterium]
MILLVGIADMKDENLLLVNAGSVNIRKGPSSGSELLTQALMGEELRAYRRDNGWYLVRMADGYCGWVADRGVLSVSRRHIEEYGMKVNKMVVSNTARIYSEPAHHSLCMEEMVAGSRIAADDNGGGSFLRVTLPSGDEGFMDRSATAGAGPPVETGPAGVLRRAAGFMGVPYLWGGATSRGFDCSGLVKRVFDMEGVILPRDSDLQAESGEEIDPEDAVRNRPGALIFFSGGKGINHVAISAGRGNFIHCRGSVRIENLDHPDCSLSGKNVCRAVLVL